MVWHPPPSHASLSVCSNSSPSQTIHWDPVLPRGISVGFSELTATWPPPQILSQSLYWGILEKVPLQGRPEGGFFGYPQCSVSNKMDNSPLLAQLQRCDLKTVPLCLQHGKIASFSRRCYPQVCSFTNPEDLASCNGNISISGLILQSCLY